MEDVSTVKIASTSTEKVQGKDTLEITLDGLWVEYLNLLSRYQRLRQDLSKSFSTGFINLAEANFSNPNRIRYGQDYYDDRMQASTTVTTEPFQFITSSLQEKSSDEANPKSEGTEEDPSDSPAESQIHEKARKPSRENDPLRWFGILVPPALRISQATFHAALSGPVCELVSVDAEMRALEIEIRRTRKKLRKATDGG